MSTELPQMPPEPTQNRESPSMWRDHYRAERDALLARIRALDGFTQHRETCTRAMRNFDGSSTGLECSCGYAALRDHLTKEGVL